MYLCGLVQHVEQWAEPSSTKTSWSNRLRDLVIEYHDRVDRLHRDPGSDHVTLQRKQVRPNEQAS
jgi:hypothetical protein